MKVGHIIPRDCLPPQAPHAPTRIVVPRGAWDTHAHVIGAPPEHPWVSPRNYDPPPASIDDYIAHLDTLGIDFGVLVQISVHGTDNGALVAALRAHPTRLCGIAVVAPEIGDNQLAALDAAGICGVRLVTLVAGGVGLESAPALAERIAPLGWHLQIATDGATLQSALPMLRTLRIPIVIDHFGGCDPADPSQRDLLLQIVQLENCYVKLSAAYRLDAAPWRSVSTMARSLIAAAPDRLLWGSDWPHVALTDSEAMPRTDTLLDLIEDWTTNSALQRTILVDNPTRLYGRPNRNFPRRLIS